MGNIILMQDIDLGLSPVISSIHSEIKVIDKAIQVRIQVIKIHKKSILLTGTIGWKSLRWLGSTFLWATWSSHRILVSRRWSNRWFQRAVLIVDIVSGAENILLINASNSKFTNRIEGIFNRVFFLRTCIFWPFERGWLADTARAAKRTIYVRLFGTSSIGNFFNRPTEYTINIYFLSRILK